MCRQSAVDIVALSTAEKPFYRDRKWIFIDFRSLFTPSRSERKFSTCLTMSWSLFTLLSAVDNWIIQLIFQPAPFHHLLLPNSRGTMAFNECKTLLFFDSTAKNWNNNNKWGEKFMTKWTFTVLSYHHGSMVVETCDDGEQRGVWKKQIFKKSSKPVSRHWKKLKTFIRGEKMNMPRLWMEFLHSPRRRVLTSSIHCVPPSSRTRVCVRHRREWSSECSTIDGWGHRQNEIIPSQNPKNLFHEKSERPLFWFSFKGAQSPLDPHAYTVDANEKKRKVWENFPLLPHKNFREQKIHN